MALPPVNVPVTRPQTGQYWRPLMPDNLLCPNGFWRPFLTTLAVLGYGALLGLSLPYWYRLGRRGR